MEGLSDNDTHARRARGKEKTPAPPTGRSYKQIIVDNVLAAGRGSVMRLIWSCIVAFSRFRYGCIFGDDGLVGRGQTAHESPFSAPRYFAGLRSDAFSPISRVLQTTFSGLSR